MNEQCKIVPFTEWLRIRLKSIEKGIIEIEIRLAKLEDEVYGRK